MSALSIPWSNCRFQVLPSSSSPPGCIKIMWSNRRHRCSPYRRMPGSGRVRLPSLHTTGEPGRRRLAGWGSDFWRREVQRLWKIGDTVPLIDLREKNYSGKSFYWNSELSRLMTKPTKWHVRQAKTRISLGIRPVWSESSLCAQWVANDPSFLHADSEDSDQTGRWLNYDLYSCNYMIWATSWENLFMLYANKKGADQPAHQYNTSTCYSQNFKTLASLISWAGRFES